MRALVVYCHPNPESYSAAVRDVVLAELAAVGAEIDLIDLHAEGFDPVMSREELAGHFAVGPNVDPVAEHVAKLQAADTLIFIYPTWWYGLPAMLKGWLDRVLLPGVAFLMPEAEGEDIKPGLTQIRRLGVFTTCGASWWLTRLIGAPGRRTLLRGVRVLCHRRARTVFAAHYLMDSSTAASRARHLNRVEKSMRRFVGRGDGALRQAALVRGSVN